LTYAVTAKDITEILTSNALRLMRDRRRRRAELRLMNNEAPPAKKVEKNMWYGLVADVEVDWRLQPKTKKKDKEDKTGPPALSPGKTAISFLQVSDCSFSSTAI
jgi:hypothetical protein